MASVLRCALIVLPCYSILFHTMKSCRCFIRSVGFVEECLRVRTTSRRSREKRHVAPAISHGGVMLGSRRNAHLIVAGAVLLFCVISFTSTVNADTEVPSKKKVSSKSGLDGAVGQDVPRWSQYVPHNSQDKSLAEELVEARELSRRHREATKVENAPPIERAVRNKESTSGQKSKTAPKGGLRQGVKALRKATSKARSRVQDYLDDVFEEDEDDEDEDDEDDQWTGPRRSSRGRNSNTKKSSTKDGPSFLERIWWLIVATCHRILLIAGVICTQVVWTPMTYIGAAVKWSASTSWQTTAWTGQHALIGPARTATAPLFYLVDGLLFIFVWTPAKVVRIVVRELYPI